MNWEGNMQQHSYHMFCLPPAGSSASIYYPWKKITSQYLDIIPMEYAGHGMKMQQALINHPDIVAKNIVDEILTYPEKPFILFGHSVGGGLVWKVKDQLENINKLDLLKMMVISSRPEHRYIQHIKDKRQLSDLEIIAKLKRYNHFPEEILNHADALAFFLRIIRNDFLLSDQLLSENIIKTSIPVLTFHGKDDPDIPDPKAMQAWQQHTEKWLGSVELEGDHFYFLNKGVLGQMIEHIENRIDFFHKSNEYNNSSFCIL